MVPNHSEEEKKAASVMGRDSLEANDAESLLNCGRCRGFGHPQRSPITVVASGETFNTTLTVKTIEHSTVHVEGGRGRE